MIARLICRLRGHRWAPWWPCLRPDLEITCCMRCGKNWVRQREFYEKGHGWEFVPGHGNRIVWREPND